jgi:quercetin dioxygenase-like cupin family protein
VIELGYLSVEPWAVAEPEVHLGVLAQTESIFALSNGHIGYRAGGPCMKRWNLLSLTGSSDKRPERGPGADAPRVPSVGRQKPRVLFSSPQCRAVVLDLVAGEELGAHHVRERAVLQVVFGRVSIEASGHTVDGTAGTLVALDPGERHSLHGIDNARLLLMLAPWPATGHNAPSESAHDQHLPANATVNPID